MPVPRNAYGQFAAALLPLCGQSACRAPGCQSGRDGYSPDGYDREGWDRLGWDREGFDRAGYDRAGYDRAGYNRVGYDQEGYNAAGYNRAGYDQEGYDQEGYNAAGYNWDGYRRGDTHDSDDDQHDALCAYNYSPELEFQGDKGPYYGMEIEVTVDRVRDAVELVNNHAPYLKYSPLIWCKSDSSVDGMEMVTHPMSYDWAMANFPWDMLPALRDQVQATVIPQENGIHVHVGRDAFDGSAHLYRWLKLWYRNPNDIQRIARRRAHAWAAFEPRHRKAQKEHVKKGKPGYSYGNDETARVRYSAINTTNDNTLEVRVFASSLRPRRVKAALQLVAGSVEYTRQLSPEAICARHGWDWRAFMSWVRRDGRYPDLVAEDRNRKGP